MPPPFRILLLTAVATSVLAQGPLTPPGTPAPTMKTLDQVEPRKEVNATNTPGDGVSVFRISAPGSYYLSANVTGVASKSGVVIAADDVSLDLNGFEVKGIAGSVSGIVLSGTRENCLIRNGAIREWDVKGIDGGFGFFAVYENLRVSDNGGIGIHVGSGSVVRSCVVSDNGSHGFQCLSVSGGHTIRVVVMEHCLATGNGGDGFRLTNTTIRDCVAELNGGKGITVFSVATEALTATNCMAISNTGDGISAGVGSTLTNCTAKENGGTYGIFAGEGSTLTGCTAYSNDVESGIRADDRSTLTNCTASLNTSAAADSWGISAGAQCTISNCSANGNLNTNATPSDSTGGGILAGNSSNIQNCTVVGNKGDGIQIGSDSRVIGNNCDSNNFGGGNAAGIHSTGADNRIEGNNVTDNTRGIDVDSSGSLIIKNSASGNSTNFDIAASNSFGPLVTVAGVGDISGTVNANHPWANFGY